MELSEIGASTAPTLASKSRFSELSPEEFVKIITTELSHQDPLEPNDTGALLEQISSIRSIQSQIDLGAQIGSLVSQNEFASASGLIGKTVGGFGSAGAALGVVQSVIRSTEGALLKLEDGTLLPMTGLTRIDATGVTP